MGKEKNETEIINCLRNEKVVVRFIAKPRGLISDPNHVLYGNLARGAKIYYTTPLLRSGGYANVLTKEEKECLERVLGVGEGGLSVYKKENNFWDDSNPEGAGRVVLTKGDTILDLSNPMDYIHYKILLANKDFIASSMQELQDKAKATYKFVIISEADTAKESNTKVNRKAQAYMLFGKISDNWDKMATIIELFTGSPVSSNSKLEFLQGKIGDIIESNTKMFIQLASDPYLDAKCLIKKAIKAGVIVTKGDYLYLKDGNLPLCENNQEPTFNIAAAFIANPKRQELKFSLEAKV